MSYKHKTDRDRLFRYCTANAASKEFFIQKAIDWALREYAKVDKQAVVEYICLYDKQLSKLSKREGLKHINAG